MTEFAPVDWNLRECFRALTLQREGAEAFFSRGVHFVSLNVQFQMFNAAFLASPVETGAELQRRISNATVQFGMRGIPWSFWVCDGLLSPPVRRRAEWAFAAHGMSLATQMPGMRAAALRSPGRALPALEIREVAERGTLDDFRDVGSQCFRVPPAWFEEVFDLRTLHRIPFRAWVGYAEGRPVATAATVAAVDSLGIYNVATLPPFRCMGYAEQLMRQAVEREQAGLDSAASCPRPVVLQSTLAGVSLYERMGFETVTRFRVWISP